ncbi:FG-GAP repeat protein [Pseudoalteromonas piscicida]|uniref:FG-GAP repeat protein n=1 Tax=Pseudoalteromonas piscicida TaxID=43662 RepID=UPI001CB83F0B|nr:FG-GAP repeat protein [Pseudoalteromonas piscicida]
MFANDAAPEDRFGWNIAVSNNTAIIATPTAMTKEKAQVPPIFWIWWNNSDL